MRNLLPLFLGQTQQSNGTDDSRRVSSRGLIPKAKIKTIKMTFSIVLGKWITMLIIIVIVVISLFIMQHATENREMFFFN